jgi:NTE family protein
MSSQGARVFHFLRGRGKNGDRSVKAEEPVEPRIRQRPTIGLALGGGAARGFAHIGIMQRLIEAGIKPDVIAGTSIGALAGGLYAAGRLDPFAEWSQQLTRRSVFGYLDFSFSGAGLIGGDRLADRLNRELAGLTIEELSVRFAAIATEVGTGHEIWLTRGRLVDALRAAYALPGIFAPVLIGQRWLVDGALVNPVPVSAARALGARLVIAVNLNSDLFGRGVTIASHGPDEPAAKWLDDKDPAEKSDLLRDVERAVKRQVLNVGRRPGIPTVMMDAFNIMQDRITRARLAGDPPDVSINPRLGGIGLFEFHRAAESIALGREAAERALDQIHQAVDALA